MPTDQLRKALLEAGPDETQVIRLQLIAAGEMALADSDPACFLYGALASAISVDDADVYPHLVAAALKVTDLDSGRVPQVIKELLAGDPEQTGLVGALAREVYIAALEVARAVFRARAELKAARGVPEEWTDNPNR
jgi:hypothetical protein